jgi:hypothetical protein
MKGQSPLERDSKKPPTPLGAIGRHCEERSDEAIQLSACGDMDCFAALAMTVPKSHGSIKSLKGTS